MRNHQLYARILRLLTDHFDYCLRAGDIPFLQMREAERAVIAADAGLVWC